jgi:DNA-directed RNA polymerase subunit RPC12/RpoP
MEDTIYTCRQCGAELVRSSIRKATTTPGAEAA